MRAKTIPSVALVAVLTVLALGLAGCTEQKAAVAPYADLKAAYQGVSDAQDQLASGLQAAADGAKVATVLKTYTAKMRELSPRIQEAQAKYPEMAKAVSPPAELQGTVEALNDSTGKMMEALAKVQQYLDDPAVTAAMDDLSAAARAAQ